MFTERGIARIQRAANRQERLAIRSSLVALRQSNPIGWKAVRSSRAAAKRFRRAAQLRLALENRFQSEAEEKRQTLKRKRREFDEQAPWTKRKRKVVVRTVNKDSPDSQKH